MSRNLHLPRRICASKGLDKEVFWNKTFVHKTQGGHVHPIKWLYYDTDRALIGMHKIKVNNDESVQF